MSSHLYLITGASRGLGLEIARQLLLPGNELLCISRQTSNVLARQASAVQVPVWQWQQDLSDGAAACARLATWLREVKPGTYASATLINNAALIPPIGPLHETSAADLALALRVGLEAPMQLSATFLRGTDAWRATRKVLNISSGLGRRAMASQAAYCAVKAGMDHFTRCLALEEALRPHGARVCSLAPGVIDTDMQQQLRSADASAFPDQSYFKALQTEGKLMSAAQTAESVLRYLNRPDFGDNPIGDVRDA